MPVSSVAAITSAPPMARPSTADAMKSRRHTPPQPKMATGWRFAGLTADTLDPPDTVTFAAQPQVDDTPTQLSEDESAYLSTLLNDSMPPGDAVETARQGVRIADVLLARMEEDGINVDEEAAAALGDLANRPALAVPRLLRNALSSFNQEQQRWVDGLIVEAFKVGATLADDADVVISDQPAALRFAATDTSYQATPRVTLEQAELQYYYHIASGLFLTQDLHQPWHEERQIMAGLVTVMQNRLRAVKALMPEVDGDGIIDSNLSQVAMTTKHKMLADNDVDAVRRCLHRTISRMQLHPHLRLVMDEMMLEQPPGASLPLVLNGTQEED